MAANETRRVQLTYPLEQVDKPILYHLVTDYGLVPDIRRAAIDPHSGGFIVLELTGDGHRLDRALEWLEDLGITVAPVGLDSTSDWAT